jgi:glycine dehydrogenase subunit 1
VEDNMGSYLALTDADRGEMLTLLGLKEADELFSGIPENVKLEKMNLPSGLSEMEVNRKLSGIAAENRVFPHIFRGAGAYRHYIPAAVKRISSHETFLTAYTPYQAELSQGILQSIFEYQSMICELTGMDVANASVYDGASAAAEAVNMCRERNHRGVFVSASAHPQVIQTIRTYCMGYGVPVTVIPKGVDGKTDRDSLKKLLTASSGAAAAFYVQNPNFLGLIEDVPALSEITHNAGAFLVAGVNPISLGLLESPGSQGADIAVGEGQPLGMPLAFGGPYLGFMACKSPLMRKLPGRIVGETTDSRGGRAFVLTLQAREQHIRREKALSNICSNEAHCALTAAIYLAVMGEEGFAEAASQCHAKAAYAAALISAVPGFPLVYDGEFFHEFVTRCPDTGKTLDCLEKHGILGGYPISPNELLWCATELNTREEIDDLVRILREMEQ